MFSSQSAIASTGILLVILITRMGDRRHQRAHPAMAGNVVMVTVLWPDVERHPLARRLETII